MSDMVIMNWMLLMIVTSHDVNINDMDGRYEHGHGHVNDHTDHDGGYEHDLLDRIDVDEWRKKKNRTGLMLISLAVKIQLLMMTMMLKRWR